MHGSKLMEELIALREAVGPGWDASMRNAIITLLVGPPSPGDGGAQTKRFFQFACAYAELVTAGDRLYRIYDNGSGE